MKLNLAEKLLVNNPARALVQHFFEGPLLRSLGGRLENGRVLEIGCGRGVGIQIALEQFGANQVYGLDLDRTQVCRARKKLASKFDGRVFLAVARAEQLPFPDHFFDAVFDFGALHHVENWQESVAEIRQVLKPGGLFFFEELTRAALNRPLYQRFLDHPIDNRFSEAEFIAELATNQIELLQTPKRIWANDIFIGVAKRKS